MPDTPPLPFSALVRDVIAIGHDMIKPSEAGAVIGRAHSTLSQACTKGEIEAQSSCVRGRGTRKRWTFSRAALLAYMWRHTSGDKALLRAALAQHCPELLAFLDPQAAQPLPENVIPMHARRPRRAADPLADHIGDLFARHAG